MSDNPEIIQPDSPVLEPSAPLPPPPPPRKRGSKIAWIVGGCGCLLLIVVAIIVGLLVYFGPMLFGKDPIAAVVPADSIFYMNVDLVKGQSNDLGKIVSVFQEIAGQDQKSLVNSIDSYMSENLHMTFTDAILPWIGRYGAFVVTSGDLSSGDAKYMLIVQTRNNSQADKFIQDFTKALEDYNLMTFSQEKVNGVTLYVHKAENDWEKDSVIARAGKFVYIANSEEAVLESAKLQKSASLAGSKMYQAAIAALPSKRLATLYVGGQAYADLLSTMMSEMYSGALSSADLENSGLGGIAMGVSAVDVGLRIDVAISYDAAKLSDFQKDSLKAFYKNPATDNLVPEDTFIYMGANSSQSPGRLLQEGSPLYNQDVKDSLDLLDKQYGIDIQELLNLLGGEVGFAVGPSTNSIFSTSGVDLGFMFLASTNDEAGANKWLDNLASVASKDMYMQFTTTDAQVGKYNLQELSVDTGGEKVTFLLYGADNGYIVLGMGQDMLEQGLSGQHSLANNATYRNTWKAFPSGSVPYMYVDLAGLVKVIKSSADPTAFKSVEKGLAKIPVIALSMNKPHGYTLSSTLIVFIDTGK